MLNQERVKLPKLMHASPSSVNFTSAILAEAHLGRSILTGADYSFQSVISRADKNLVTQLSRSSIGVLVRIVANPSL